jgi:hypothetical protein
MMICDSCLMFIYKAFKSRKKVRKVFFALQVDDFPTLNVLQEATGLARHDVRGALNLLQGAGLVWGGGCHGLSDSGRRLLELLRDTDQPEPAEALCEDCLLEIGEFLPADGYAVLSQLSNRPTHSRHDLIMSTAITDARLRDVLQILEGARLIQGGRGRFFRLSETGRRLERLLRRRQRASQWESTDSSSRSTVASGPLSLSTVTGEGGL